MATSRFVTAQGESAALAAPVRPFSNIEVLVVLDEMFQSYRVVVSSPRGATTILDTFDFLLARGVAQRIADVADVSVSFSDRRGDR